MKYNPGAHARLAAEDADIVVHELAHHVSAGRQDAEKRALATTFLHGCKVYDRMKPALVLEEPLAVAVQKAYLLSTDRTRVDFFGSWYGDPWVAVFARSLVGPVAALLESNGVIDDAFVRRSARLCSQIEAAAARIHR